LSDYYGIAGLWIGTCNFGSGMQPCNIVISQDGAFNANSGATSLFGRATVAGGRAAFDAGTVGGDIAVYDTDACRRHMVVKGSKGTATADVSQDGAPARMVSSLSEVAGRWAGTCDLGSGMVACSVTIGTDGSFSGSAGASSAVGKVAVVSGRAVFDTGGAAGDIVLHEGSGCQRQIAVAGARGVARGRLTAQ